MARYHPASIQDDIEAGFSGHSASPVKPASSPRRPGGRPFCDPCDDAGDILSSPTTTTSTSASDAGDPSAGTETSSCTEATCPSVARSAGRNRSRSTRRENRDRSRRGGQSRRDRGRRSRATRGSRSGRGKQFWSRNNRS
uniref:Uncharacterized protein n=1 Tax=Oryza brachyantha TaxID=4533 RepID=J3M0T2_ORYBR